MIEQGLLVHGSNHFIVNGRRPSMLEARALARFWELPMPGAVLSPALAEWSICTKAFRENLTWAVVLAGDAKPTEAVTVLLEELAGRGVGIDAQEIR